MKVDDLSLIVMEGTIHHESFESSTFSTHPALPSSPIFSKSGANGLPACRIVMKVDDSSRIVSNRHEGDDSSRFVSNRHGEDDLLRIVRMVTNRQHF